MNIEPIAYIKSPYLTKFGVPRQPNVVDALVSTIECELVALDFDPRAVSQGCYLWLIWDFSHNHREDGEWARTVRPPRLGGTKRVGVFASRSSFRPNNLAISAVRFVGCEYGEKTGIVRLKLAGADLVDGTPVYTIRLYDEIADSHVEATWGWPVVEKWPSLAGVDASEEVRASVDGELWRGIEQVLVQDPRPAYTREGQEDREFWVPLADIAVWFKVVNNRALVTRVRKLGEAELARLKERGSL